MKKKLFELRKSYDKLSIDFEKLPSNPMDLFKIWFDEVSSHEGVDEVNAFTLSTINSIGDLRSRVVLLKKIVNESFIFFTNYESEKAQSIFHNPKVCMSFYWPNLERQIIINGKAIKSSKKISDEYFKSRPRGSQLGAHVSPQSREIPSKNFLIQRLKKIENKYKGVKIPRPTNWGGIKVTPHSYEFWQGRPNRLHDRVKFFKVQSNWEYVKLAP